MTNTAPNISKQDDVTVITLSPTDQSFDEEGLEQVTRVILDVVQTANPRWVVIDMSQKTFFASSLIAVLTQGWKQMKDRDDGKFVISGLTPFGAEVISAARLDRVWDIYPTLDEAVQALSSS